MKPWICFAMGAANLQYGVLAPRHAGMPSCTGGAETKSICGKCGNPNTDHHSICVVSCKNHTLWSIIPQYQLDMLAYLVSNSSLIRLLVKVVISILMARFACIMHIFLKYPVSPCSSLYNGVSFSCHVPKLRYGQPSGYSHPQKIAERFSIKVFSDGDQPHSLINVVATNMFCERLMTPCILTLLNLEEVVSQAGGPRPVPADPWAKLAELWPAGWVVTSLGPVPTLSLKKQSLAMGQY